MDKNSTYQELYNILSESDFGCVPTGFHDTEEVYEIIQQEYPDLCDDSIKCRDVCGTDKEQPEWKHRVGTLQQSLDRSSESGVANLSKGWYYPPSNVDVVEVPEDPSEFEEGSRYNRWELHDRFGGQRYNGISTPSDRPFVFIFTGESGDDYGYEDEFIDDTTFLYTGEGAEGDMEMTGGNEAICNHRSEGENLYLFEDTRYPWIVTYVTEMEYVDHYWETLPDQEGEDREAIRFRLQPIDSEVEIEDDSSLSKEELYERAKRSSGGSSTSGGSGGRTYSRSKAVKEYALREADGVCQGCGEEAPFIGEDGEPFLEVHHLHRRSDGGPDDPDNVVALCPNCHRRVHHGKDGDEFNQKLIEKTTIEGKSA